MCLEQCVVYIYIYIYIDNNFSISLFKSVGIVNDIKIVISNTKQATKDCNEMKNNDKWLSNAWHIVYLSSIAVITRVP